MQVTILYFAAARDAAGCAEEQVDLPEEVKQVSELVIWLGRRFPLLVPHLGCLRIARNEQFVADDDVISRDDVLAVLPPVSGG